MSRQGNKHNNELRKTTPDVQPSVEMGTCTRLTNNTYSEVYEVIDTEQGNSAETVVSSHMYI